MRKLFLCLVVVMMANMAIGQETTNTSVVEKSNYVVSDAGKMVKIIDVEMPLLGPFGLGRAHIASIRIVSVDGSNNNYYYTIEDSSGKTMIEYSDLVDVTKALGRLMQEADTDAATQPHYLENRFTTEDGFQVGYSIKKKKVTWFAGSSEVSIVIFNKENVINLLDAFLNAQKKIEELKSIYGI